jgi:hypothetical protein
MGAVICRGVPIMPLRWSFDLIDYLFSTIMPCLRHSDKKKFVILLALSILGIGFL